MFCPNCGKENEDNALYCGYCGAKILDDMNQDRDDFVYEDQTVETQNQQNAGWQEANQQNTGWQEANQQNTGWQEPNWQSSFGGSGGAPIQRELKPFDKKMLVPIIEAAVLVCLIVAFFKIGSFMLGYESVAKQYFINASNGNWETVYSMLDIPDADFMDKESFLAATKNNKVTPLNQCEIESSNSGKMEAYVDISSRSKGSSYSDYDTITLLKQKKSAFLVFPSWKVSPADWICNDYVIDVPSGAKVILDGKELGKNTLSSHDEYKDEYIISSIFNGTHNIVVSIEGYDITCEEVKIDDMNAYYSVNSVVFPKDVQEEAIDAAYDYYQKILNAALHQQDYSVVQDLYSASIQRDARSGYESLVEDFTYDEYSYKICTEIKMLNVSGEVTDCGCTDGTICLGVCLDYSYQISGKKQDWFDGSWSEYTDTDGNDYNIDMILEDGSWKINQGSIPYIYY